MIIFGSRGITTTRPGGMFHCPRCGPQRRYAMKEVRRWFTLYFIPVIPMNKAGEFVECTQCAGTFGPEAVHYDPETQKREVAAKVRYALVAVASRADDVSEARLALLETMLERAGADPSPPDELRAEVERVARATGPLATSMAGADKFFSEDGKGMLMLAAYRILSGSGDLSNNAMAVYRDFGAALGIRGLAFDKMLEVFARKS